jgi:hypothetical protein
MKPVLAIKAEEVRGPDEAHGRRPEDSMASTLSTANDVNATDDEEEAQEQNYV